MQSISNGAVTIKFTARKRARAFRGLIKVYEGTRLVWQDEVLTMRLNKEDALKDSKELAKHYLGLNS